MSSIMPTQCVVVILIQNHCCRSLSIQKFSSEASLRAVGFLGVYGRQPRIHIPNTIHHVMIRGNNRQRIFYGDECFSYFLSLLKGSTEKHDHKMLAFCLMTNHVHMIIHVHDSPLSVVMKNIN